MLKESKKTMQTTEHLRRWRLIDCGRWLSSAEGVHSILGYFWAFGLLAEAQPTSDFLAARACAHGRGGLSFKDRQWKPKTLREESEACFTPTLQRSLKNSEMPLRGSRRYVIHYVLRTEGAGSVMAARDVRHSKNQRRMYAQRRASKAVERLVSAKTSAAKAQAAKWARLWEKVAGMLRF
ncbi:hypothetical protein [Caballeronia grimmiae]|uniref:hypothetical protein n=1 Tax=Caballeronia grimmiae TaxID=1071679 RepID=UPI0038BD4FB3